MKTNLILLAACLCVLTCKQETKTEHVSIDYKYPSVENILDCNPVETDLLREAFYSFEDDLVKFYTPGQAVYSRAYSLFVSQALTGKVDYSKMVSAHSKVVLEALKQDKDLWANNPDGSKLNYNHPFFKCVGAHIQDEPLKKTFNALIDTNSMSLRMFGDQLKRKTFGMKDDKYLATYVALELFYGKIYDMDLSQQAPTPTQANQTEEHSSHDGHNH